MSRPLPVAGWASIGAVCLHFFRPDARLQSFHCARPLRIEKVRPRLGLDDVTADQLASRGSRGWCDYGLSASWILCAGVTVLGWVAAEPGSLLGALQLGTLLWLLSNGVGVVVGTIPVTLVPWGATLVIAFMISRFAAASARQVRADQKASPGLISVVTVTAYQLPVLVWAVLWGEPWRAPARWAVAIGVYLLAAWWGSSRNLASRPAEVPRWARDHHAQCWRPSLRCSWRVRPCWSPVSGCISSGWQRCMRRCTQVSPAPSLCFCYS